MSENPRRPLESRAWFGIAVVAVAALGAGQVYLARQLDRLLALQDGLLGTKAQLEQVLARFAPGQPPAHRERELDATTAPLPHQDAILSQLGAMAKSIAALKHGDCQVSPSLPGFAAGAAPPLPVSPPGAFRDWRANLQPEIKVQADRVMREHAERLRERIAAETDPLRPDTAVVQRVMEQSRNELAAQMSEILPQESYEALFPAWPEPEVSAGAHPLMNQSAAKPEK